MSNIEPVIKDLVQRRTKALENSTLWKAEAARIDAQISEIINPEKILTDANKMKSGGSLTTELHGAKFVVEASKTVSWDSDKLQNVAAKLSWNVVKAIFKIKFEVAEAKFKDLAVNAQAGMFDQETFNAIRDARTVKIGEPKIKSAEIVNQ